MKPKIEEIIVVEGRDDTKRIQQVLEADTIETNGSALSDETLEKIEHAQQVRGVIVFTDPDFSGEKIRKQIMEVVPDAKHAFISRKEGEPTKRGNSLGVEHASDEVILDAIKRISTASAETFESTITGEDLIHLGLVAGPKAKQRREALGDKLKIGYTNGKQLKKRLSMFKITEEMFAEAMKEILEDEKNDGIS